MPGSPAQLLAFYEQHKFRSSGDGCSRNRYYRAYDYRADCNRVVYGAPCRDAFRRAALIFHSAQAGSCSLADRPPSSATVAPVRNPADSDARNTASLATSSGSPMRPAG